MGQQVGNCNSFTSTHYLANVFAMHCGPRASPVCVQHCIQLTSLSFQVKLEQLERLRSEDTPHRLMITHTIESYWIPSQKMTKSKSQILKIRQNFKFLNFVTGITRDTPSEVA